MMALSKQPLGVPLAQLLQGLIAPDTEAQLQAAAPVGGVSDDSRDTAPGDLFLACKGVERDGAAFIAAAVRAGAAAVALEQGLAAPPARPNQPPRFIVPDLARKAGLIAARFHGHPSRALSLTGVTGTNGKTSVAWLLAWLYTRLAGKPCGLIGTLGAGVFPRLKAGRNTTPGAVAAQKLMAGFAGENIEAVFMEVSSHALDQGRANGLRFHSGVFTNLSRDHLDYHGDMRSYRDSKAKLFQSEGLRRAVINVDDAVGAGFVADLRRAASKESAAAKEGPEIVTYSIAADRPAAAVTGSHLQATLKAAADGYRVALSGDFGSGAFTTRLLGDFNVSNLLAATAVLLRAGFPLARILEALEQAPPPPGRLERFALPNGARAFVDYAHTPAALEQALAALRRVCGANKLICVFGCGGERDREKRPLMGAAAARLADRVIVTDDNPRAEPGQSIVDDILAGMQKRGHVSIERDRSAAIREALAMAREGDIVLIAGKGHETFQIVGAKRLPFSDRQQVRNCSGAPA